MMRFSPLFWPVELKGRTIYILDETLLPHKVKHIQARNYQQAVTAIKQMKTRAVGQVLLVMYTFLLEAKKNHSLAHLKKVAHAFCASRPTLSFRSLTEMVLAWAKQGAPLEKYIFGFLEILKEKRIQQAKQAAKLIKNNDVILTHCNISGQMPLIADFCRKDKKKISFFVTETRPYLQGARLTAWELRRQGFAVTLITDNMVAAVMSQGKVDKVIVGADNLAQNGDIANKVGTYQIAVVARHFHIPFYVLCPPKSGAKSGAEIKIEMRPEKEMLYFDGRLIAAKGVRGYYPAFDITPRNLITRHIYLEV
ncbi:MAG: S-methyl-5-thioribose-1-phosphate isomerase [Candidatus Omnitrophota bacterium]|jgi:methylthioribose-1-phosphate isomerase